MTVWEYRKDKGDRAFYLLSVFFCAWWTVRSREHNLTKHSNDSDCKMHRLLSSDIVILYIYIYYLCDVSNFSRGAFSHSWSELNVWLVFKCIFHLIRSSSAATTRVEWRLCILFFCKQKFAQTAQQCLNGFINYINNMLTGIGLSHAEFIFPLHNHFCCGVCNGGWVWSNHRPESDHWTR